MREFRRHVPPNVPHSPLSGAQRVDGRAQRRCHQGAGPRGNWRGRGVGGLRFGSFEFHIMLRLSSLLITDSYISYFNLNFTYTYVEAEKMAN